MAKGGRWALLTFGAGLPNWRAAAARLGRQARQIGWFDTVIVLTDRDLRSQYPDFAVRHKRILSARTRGYGFWIWKSYLIGEVWKALQASHNGLFYLDGGCQLNDSSSVALHRWRSYQEMALDCGVFAMHLPGHPEEHWSRLATMDRLALSPEQRRSPQVQGGIVAISGSGRDLVAEWQSLSVEANYEFVRDATPCERNSPDFREHRHDQAIFSGLAKRYGVPTIPDETFWAPNWRVAGSEYPIWAARNRTRIPVEAEDPWSRALRFGEKASSRVLSGIVQLGTRA